MSLATLKNKIKRKTNSEKYIFFFLDDKIKDKYSSNQDYYQVAALQFLEISKSFLDTFKPYKTTKHIKEDLKFILNGFLFSFWNAMNLAIILFSFAFTFPIALLVQPLDTLLDFSEFMTFVLNISALLISAIFRALTELVFSPIILLRIPLRAAITWHQGWPTFEGNPGLNRTLEQGEAILREELTPEKIEDCKYIIEHLNYKTIKAKALKQYTQLLNFDQLPHVEKNASFESRHNYNSEHKLPEQTNEIFLKAKRDLALVNNGVDPKPALREYFRLFRLPNDNNEERRDSPLNNMAARM